jgi:hypothetical protein
LQGDETEYFALRVVWRVLYLKRIARAPFVLVTIVATVEMIVALSGGGLRNGANMGWVVLLIQRGGAVGGVLGWVNESWRTTIEQGCRLLHRLQIAVWSELRCPPLRGLLRIKMAAAWTGGGERMNENGQEGLLHPMNLFGKLVMVLEDMLLLSCGVGWEIFEEA